MPVTSSIEATTLKCREVSGTKRQLDVTISPSDLDLGLDKTLTDKNKRKVNLFH